MKTIFNISVLAVLLVVVVVAGCHKPTPSTQSATQTNGSSGGGAGTGMVAAPSVSEWAKVRIGSSGEVSFNKKPMSLADFDTECRRLKEVGGGVRVFTDTQGHSQISKAQAEAVQKIVAAGLPIKAVQKESELE